MQARPERARRISLQEGARVSQLRAWPAQPRARQQLARPHRAAGFDHSDNRLDRHSLAFADFNFFQHARGGRGNFRVHFVGGNFEQRFIALDFVSGLFQPFGNGAFENTFAHLGHDYVNSHGLLL